MKNIKETHRIMKKALIMIAISLVIYLIIYSLTAFVVWEYNPSKMQDGERLFIVFFGTLLVCIANIAYISETNKK